MMDDWFIYLILFAVVLLFIFLLLWFIKSARSGNGSGGAEGGKRNGGRRGKAEQSQALQQGLIINCPLCNTPLAKGEDLVSRVYRPMNVSDQLCTIHGCPHCYPVRESGVRRVCPVCHKEVPVKDGHLVARLFNKVDGKKHVVVTGCTECCRGAL